MFLFLILIGLPGSRALVGEKVGLGVVEFSRYSPTSPLLSSAVAKQEQYVQLSMAQPESRMAGWGILGRVLAPCNIVMSLSFVRMLNQQLSSSVTSYCTA